MYFCFFVFAVCTKRIKQYKKLVFNDIQPTYILQDPHRPGVDDSVFVHVGRRARAECGLTNLEFQQPSVCWKYYSVQHRIQRHKHCRHCSANTGHNRC